MCYHWRMNTRRSVFTLLVVLGVLPTQVPALTIPLGGDSTPSSERPDADEPAAHRPDADEPPPPPGAWRGLDDTAAWSECVRTNTALRTTAQFRDEVFLPLLRSETLDRFAAGPDADKPWADEAKRYIEEELRWIWRMETRGRPGSDFGRAYDFTIREGSADPFLTWMSVIGQKKWHWDDKAREQLRAFEQALEAQGDAARPFDRLLAAHARWVLDGGGAEAMYRALVAWAESLSGRPGVSEAVYTTLLRFGAWDDSQLAEDLLSSGADRWIGLMLRGRRHTWQHSWESARRDLEEAYSLHPEFPGAAVQMLGVVKGTMASEPRRDLDLWFRRGLEARIDEDGLYRAYADCLEGGGISDFTPVLRFAEACYATHRHDVPVAYQYAPLIARYRRLVGIPQDEFFRRRDIFQKCDEVLQPQLLNTDAPDTVRETSVLLLAAIYYIHGDIEDAVDTAVLRTPDTYNGVLANNFDDWFTIMTVLDGLSGENGDRILPLYERFRAGDFADCLARVDGVWHECRGLSHSEASLLSKIAAESWIEARYATGEPFEFGVLRRRQFADWINWGWNLEETGDIGAAATRGGGKRYLRLQYLLPREIEISGAFEGTGPEGSGSLFLRFLDSSSIYAHYGPQPDLAMKRESGRVGVRLETRDGRTPAWAWYDLPDGPVRFRAIYRDGAVQLWIDGAGEHGGIVLAKKAPAYAHDAFPERGGLVFVGENARFLGCTVRKP